MQLTEQDEIKISYLIQQLLKEHNVRMPDDNEITYCQEHDFSELLNNIEEYLNGVEQYTKKLDNE